MHGYRKDTDVRDNRWIRKVRLGRKPKTLDFARGMPPEWELWRVGVSPDGKAIVSGGWDMVARVWNGESGELVKEIKLKNAVNFLEYSPDGKTVLAGAWLTLLRCSDWSTAWTSKLGAQCAAFSPSGTRVAAARINAVDGGPIWILKSASGEVLQKLVGTESAGD